jgi:hypothetical protein
MNNENDLILQQDRNDARALNTIPGVDGWSKSSSEIRKIRKDYLKACAVGSAVGATVGAPALGVGAGVGAVIGCAGGIGLRAYGIGIDTLNLQLDKFHREVSRYLGEK